MDVISPEIEVPTEVPMSDLEIKMMGMPTPAEIVVPPVIVVILVIMGLLVYSMWSQPLWWRHALRGPCSPRPSTESDIPVTASSTFDPYFNQRDDNHVSKFNRFQTTGIRVLTSFDTLEEEATMAEFSRFQNKPSSLLKLSVPTLLSLAFCPAAIYMYKPMAEFFWPYVELMMRPNVNNAISSFLTPAALIYAIAFGFAYQEAVARQHANVAMVTSTHGLLERILLLTSSCERFTTEQKLNIQKFLKEEVLMWIQMVMGKKNTSLSERLARYNDILARLFGTHVPTTASGVSKDVGAINGKVFDLIVELNKITAKIPDNTTSSLNILQWAFLESLGFFAFFGVLLLETQSYRLELTMCMLTVFSISLFTCVLADLDQPFHGVFRVDLSLLLRFHEVLESEWHKTLTHHHGATHICSKI